jgi:hypothetical protein
VASARAAEPIALHELLARALSDPPRVLAARAAVARADADRGMAQASYFPVLTLQASEGITYDNRQQIPDGFVNQLVGLLNPVYERTGLPTIDSDSTSVRKTRLDSLSQQVGGSANVDWSLVNVARRRAI